MTWILPLSKSALIFMHASLSRTKAAALQVIARL
jgi:hypothetical protein